MTKDEFVKSARDLNYPDDLVEGYFDVYCGFIGTMALCMGTQEKADAAFFRHAFPRPYVVRGHSLDD